MLFRRCGPLPAHSPRLFTPCFMPYSKSSIQCTSYTLVVFVFFVCIEGSELVDELGLFHKYRSLEEAKWVDENIFHPKYAELRLALLSTSQGSVVTDLLHGCPIGVSARVLASLF